MQVLGSVVERDLRKQGLVADGEELLRFTMVRLLGAVNEGVGLDRDPQEGAARKVKDRNGWLIFTATSVLLVVSTRISRRVVLRRRDLAHLATATKFGEHRLDFVFAADPDPVRYWLGVDRKTDIETLVGELEDLRASRLETMTLEDRASVLMQQADALDKLGERDRAAPIYLRVADMGVAQHSSAAAYNFGQALRRSGDIAGAISYYDRALGGDNQECVALAAMNLGHLRLLDDDLVTARAYFEQAHSIGIPGPINGLGLIDELENASPEERSAALNELRRRHRR